MIRILASKWVYAGLGILALAGITHAYLGKRDDLAKARSEIEMWRASGQALQEALADQWKLTKQAEQARIALEQENAELRMQEVEVVTRIREVYRDREVVKPPGFEQCMDLVRPSLPGECRVVRVPVRVVGLLCDTAAATGGVCAMREAAGGSDDGVPDPGATR